MSLWAKAQQLTGDSMRQVQGIYGVHFPVEVRHYFANWIEEQPWQEFDPDNPTHEPMATDYLKDLIRMIEEKAAELSSEDMFLVKLKLQETAQQFKEMYGNNPLNFVRVVNNCLSTELRLVQQQESGAPMVDDQTDNLKELHQEFEYLNKCTAQTENDLRQLQHKQESFIIQYQDSLKINGQLQQIMNTNAPHRLEAEQKLKKQKEIVDMQLSEKAQELLRLRLQLAEKHRETFKNLQQLQHKILDGELIEWKRKQQLAGNGAPFDGNLEHLQQCCEALADLNWTNRQQIKKVEFLRTQLPIDVPPNTVDLLPTLNTTITGLLSTLVTSTFIIEKQPPQVLKKDSRFTSTVRLLVGGKLNVHMNPPTVTAKIISEHQARGLLKNDKNLKTESSGEILNNTSTMEYQQASGQLAVTFRNMQLKRIKRADRKGTEAVTEEKFSILFQSQFTVGGGELVFQVWTLSLPVVVTVHGNQECNALATVLWDNAFAEPGRIPFITPEAVQWPLLADLLNTKFCSSTGGPLTPSNLNYLAQKLFGYQAEDYSNSKVTWSQFNKETITGRNFTFWEWFYAILKLTKEHLRGPWSDVFISGFISKVQAQEMLMSNCPNGTFLLRFSDSETGGITIAWVAEDPQKAGERQVWNLAPFTAKDFAIRGLPDRIKDLPNLQYLHPNIPKGDCFGKYWTSCDDSGTKQTKDGYVHSTLVSVVPGIPGIQQQPAQPMSYDNPRTPQIMQPTSPEPNYEAGSVASYADYSTFPMDEDLNTLNITDYNPEDIDHINVNELLSNYPQGAQ